MLAKDCDCNNIAAFFLPPFQCFCKLFKRDVYVESQNGFLENNLGSDKVTGPRFIFTIFGKKKYSFVI